MPYIKQGDREKYLSILMAIASTKIETKGDLEFLICKLQKSYMDGREYRYSILHDVVYATIHAGEEFKRRFLDKREDEAMETNGDVF